jgi:hypothetical protein
MVLRGVRLLWGGVERCEVDMWNINNCGRRPV